MILQVILLPNSNEYQQQTDSREIHGMFVSDAIYHQYIRIYDQYHKKKILTFLNL